MSGASEQKTRLGQLLRGKHYREFIGASRLIQRDKSVRIDREREVDAALNFICLYAGLSRWLRRQKSHGCVVLARSDHVKITVLTGREMKLEPLARSHRHLLAGPHRIGFVRRVNFEPVAANLMTSSEVCSARAIR